MMIMRAPSLHPCHFMRHSRRLICLLILVAATAVSGCQKVRDALTPTSPSPSGVGPPAPNALIHYTAIGASDALGVGSSVPCQPFSTCANGTGYVHLLTRDLRIQHEVNLINLGIPASVLSPTIQDIARSRGNNVPGNYIDHELTFLAPASTLVTVFGGVNDVNALGQAILQGAAGSTDLKPYIDTQIRAFGADFDRLIRGIKSRAPGAYIIVINVPNLAGLPYSVRYTQQERQALQYVAVGFSREANRQAGSGVVVLDLMCDASAYDPALIASDGYHPNDGGYAYLARRLLPMVNGVSSPPSSSCSQMTLLPPL